MRTARKHKQVVDLDEREERRPESPLDRISDPVAREVFERKIELGIAGDDFTDPDPRRPL